MGKAKFTVVLSKEAEAFLQAQKENVQKKIVSNPLAELN